MNSQTKINIGDRVEFVMNYASYAPKGTKGTVTSVDSTSVYIQLDSGRNTSCFHHRVKVIPKSHEFKVGDKGKTRGGDDYEVIMVRSGANQPVIATINDGISGEDVETFCSDGRYYENAKLSADDLLPPKRERTVYLNVYKSDTVVHNSDAEARRNASPDALMVAHPVTIQLSA